MPRKGRGATEKGETNKQHDRKTETRTTDNARATSEHRPAICWAWFPHAESVEPVGAGERTNVRENQVCKPEALATRGKAACLAFEVPEIIENKHQENAIVLAYSVPSARSLVRLRKSTRLFYNSLSLFTFERNMIPHAHPLILTRPPANPHPLSPTRSRTHARTLSTLL